MAIVINGKEVNPRRQLSTEGFWPDDGKSLTIHPEPARPWHSQPDRGGQDE